VYTKMVWQTIFECGVAQLQLFGLMARTTIQQ
jgi:hypothetical protein